MFIKTLITEYHVHSSHALCSCVVTRLDHFVDTKRNLPREYIVAHVALPLPPPPFERCWRSWDPISVYEPIEIPATRREWHPADDTLGVYEPDFCPWASRRPTLQRSSRGLAVPLARALVAACALRRIHPDCIGDAYAHAWFARGLWERLVDSDAAPDGSAGQDARSEDSGCSKRGLLGRCVLRGKTPATFLEVLTEKEAEECRAVEDRVLCELEAGRVEAEVWLADSAAWDKRPLTRMEAIWDIREALDRGVWAGARSDLDRVPRRGGQGRGRPKRLGGDLRLQ
ncbi:uncharacterized protein BXZ73DRAFT_106989 [Epithele typhae]|uniref:uncharacterized protein n=1 Tax=Epithele typhae TaxID=378194 RepID=UPI002007CB40|nr:uncharacterized protein BXZ73DRAFT_106989 [Epithele typhae]KAH9913341.1 hypothetical protein BXZ73DRAFT_106989 [Epithele typhae]